VLKLGPYLHLDAHVVQSDQHVHSAVAIGREGPSIFDLGGCTVPVEQFADLLNSPVLGVPIAVEDQTATSNVVHCR